MEMKLISVMIDKKLYDKVKSYCYENGFKIKAFIADALRTELQSSKNRNL